MRLLHWVASTCFLALALSACKPEATEDKTGARPADAVAKTEPAKEKSGGIFGGIFSNEPKPASLDLGEFKLLEINLGTAVDADNLVVSPKTQFGNTDKIYASVLSNGKHQGLTIKAKWTAPDGSLVAETEQALVPTAGTVSTFSISNKQPWPAGAYTLDIFLNGLVQRTVTFEVK